MERAALIDGDGCLAHQFPTLLAVKVWAARRETRTTF